MGVTEILVGIACVVAQGNGEVKSVEQRLTPKEKAFVQFVRESGVCTEENPTAALEKYLGESKELDGQIYLTGCGSCLQTSTGDI